MASATVMRRIADSTAPVVWMTLNDPPISRRKAMIRAPSRKPLIGASATIADRGRPCPACWQVPGMVTCRPSRATRWYAPEGTIQESTSTRTMSDPTITSVCGMRIARPSGRAVSDMAGESPLGRGRAGTGSAVCGIGAEDGSRASPAGRRRGRSGARASRGRGTPRACASPRRPGRGRRRPGMWDGSVR